jgi:glutamate formiminotransferase
VYISEGRAPALIRQLEAVARSAEHVTFANLFVDAPYHRSNFTLVAASPQRLAAAAATLARAALELLDLQTHRASHPRLGAVDHISCHPLAPANLPNPPEKEPILAAARGLRPPQLGGMADAASAAQSIARLLGTGPQAVPCYLYGAAHAEQRSLAAVRRQLGYFQAAKVGSWEGPLQQQPAQPQLLPGAAGAVQQTPPLLSVVPDFGPTHAPPRWGVCCVGAVPWVVNFNVLLDTDQLSVVSALARSVSGRGGGLAHVEAMALRHERGEGY